MTVWYAIDHNTGTILAYVTTGQAEGRNLDTFNEARYLASYPDLLDAFGSDLAAATEHYIRSGYFEQRKVDLFDPSQYLASYDDLLNAFGNGVRQVYVQKGRYVGNGRKLSLLV